jgi:pyruvate dehydrogenase E2 component (dihydrolipoamide acetyltransferase)
MAYEVKLPDIGEGVAEGEIVRWLVQPGEAVKEDQPLVEVMTDKATVDIPSPRNGVVAALHAREGQVVNVGATIITIEVEGAGAPAPAPHAGASAGGRVQATPAVRQLAKQLGVAIESIAGSGPGGSVTADDVKRAVPGAAPPRAADALEERVPLRGLRRKIAEHMRHSLDTAAQFTFVAECDMTDLAAHRAALRERASAAGVKLTYLAYIVKALVASLREFPMLNATLDDAAGEIVIKRGHHVAVATDTPAGLTVPVVRDAGARTLFDLAREIDRLAQGARAGTLRLEELQGGTITVSSTGTRGGVMATPILHHPQVAILGIHEIKPRPAVRDGQIVIRELGNLSLSLDHRVVDGAMGSEFLYDLIRRLESPATWLPEQEIA